ncbi:DUF1302 domain-containing protein [Pseudomonas sp. LS1212]|uniref:DUF1302 domain-containing protein n=1 Tax=Pseudomonas sp. LS1212 TaxID=2972478 RepID=UPI00215C7AC7|nr:DUF1302 domain-containing protein [Pseudomonas sp. LS1212]UVJ45728.1 DUF1302 domain-containing protein [Pseudomonas sp. LS1212]
MKNYLNRNKRMWFVVQAASACMVSLAGTTSVQAYTFDTGNPDYNLSLGGTLRYNLGMRAEGRQDDVVAAGNNSTYSYAKGGIYTNRLDLLTELDADFRQTVGIRVSGSAWYDQAFNNSPPDEVTNYTNNHWSDTARRYSEGPSAEFLDAYVWGAHSFANGMDVTGRAGRQAVLWGEVIASSAHSISHAQAPTDLNKLFSNPGATAKETALPVGSLWGQLQLNPQWSVEGQYFYEWRPNRWPEGGTFMAPLDFVLEGPDTGFGRLRNGGIDSPHAPQFGVAVRYAPQWFSGATLGLYARQFNETSFWTDIDFAGGEYNFRYAEKTKLYGISLAKSFEGVSTGFEMSVRQDAALNSTSTLIDGEGATGNTFHALVNGQMFLGTNQLWSSALLMGELAYSRWMSVDHNEQLFNRCDTDARRAVGTDDVDYGCVTKSFSSAFLVFTPQWTAVAPGWDLSASSSLSIGLHGNAATLSGGNEGAGSYGISLTASYNQKHDFTLAFNDNLANSKRTPAGIDTTNGLPLQDRGRFVFTYQTSIF